MATHLQSLAIAHDFAPGAAPAPSERLARELTELLTGPEMGLIALGVVLTVAAVILIASQIRRLRAPKRLPAPAALPTAHTRKAEFEALRRGRMPVIPRSAEGLPARRRGAVAA